MTSEILIITNDTIVMGADSAVTIDDRKTHTGANKLFGLSDEPPMAIMIFGTTTFGSVSLESLIRDYKKQTDFKELGDILKIKKSFIEYLNNVQYEFTDFDYKLSLFKENLIEELDYKTDKEISEFLNIYEDMEMLPFLENKSSLDVEFEDIRKLLNVDIDILKRYFSAVLSDWSSSVVIAGFNKNKFKPSYISFNLITKYDDKVIISDYDSYIDCEKNFIVSFAQDDVIKTFISGVNDDFMDFLEYCINNYCNTCSNTLIKYFIENKVINVEFLENHLEDVEKLNKKNVKELMDLIENFKEDYVNLISDGVENVPAEVLVTIAGDMIETTSLKRKLDSDLDTVGGDIDIIVITIDGLTYESKIDYTKQKCLQNKEKNKYKLNH